MTLIPYVSSPIQSYNKLGQFNRYLDVYGIKVVGFSSIGGKKSVDNGFIKKIGRVIQLVLDPKRDGIDKNSQLKAIQYMATKKTIQRVGVDEYRDHII